MNFSLFFSPLVFRLPPLGVAFNLADCYKMNHLTNDKIFNPFHTIIGIKIQGLVKKKINN